MGAPQEVLPFDVDAFSKKVAREVLTGLMEIARTEDNPDILEPWQGVAKLEHQLCRKPDQPIATRKQVWKWAAAGRIPQPILLNARVARWRRGDIIAALTRKQT